MKISFEGRRAIVTGAGHGFGRAIARPSPRPAPRSWACDVNAEGLERRRENSSAGIARRRKVDVTDARAVSAFVAEAAGEGAVDILVNNAGGVRGQVGRPLEEITPQPNGRASSTST